MTTPGEPAAHAPASRRRGLWVLGIVVAAATAVAAVALLGGFNEVPIEKLPVIELGDVYSGNEVDVQVTGSYLTKQQPGYTFDADEGEQYFVVEVTLLNTQNDTDVLDTGLIRLLLGDEVLPEEEPYGVINGDTGFSMDFLQPGLEMHALYFWLIDDSVDDGDDVVVGIFERHAVEDPRYGEAGAYASEPMARIITTIGTRQ